MISKERKQNWDGELLICAKCKCFKSINKFGNDFRNRCRNLKSNYCTECANEISRLRLQKKYKNNDFDFYITRLFDGLKNRVSGSRRKNKYCLESFNITKKSLIDIYNKQNGLCALTGIKMTTISGNNKVYPENISIDKIDPNNTYEISNIQLVCYIANVMKSNLDIKQVIYYCNKLIQWQNIK